MAEWVFGYVVLASVAHWLAQGLAEFIHRPTKTDLFSVNGAIVQCDWQG